MQPPPQTIDAGLYGALASVAAITTALQATVALAPLSQLFEIEESLTKNPKGTQGHRLAQKSATKWFWRAIVLNVPAILINGSVIGSWYAASVNDAPTVLFVPWLAVAVGAGLLVVTALIVAVLLYAKSQ